MRRVLLALAAPMLMAQAGPQLVPDVSRTRIDIVYSFTGAELLAFGAILYPGGRAPARVPDVAVVVTGPPEGLLVREKAKVAGIWINHASQRFAAVPSFYAVATSRPIAALLSPAVAARYGLGVGNLSLSPQGGDPRAATRFQAGLTELRAQTGLFAEHAGEVTIRGGVLYSARLPIPARVPVGRYTVRTYLIRDGRVIAAATRAVDIDKSGFERFVANAAEREPLLYGLTAVGLSLLLGWAAAMVFRRR